MLGRYTTPPSCSVVKPGRFAGLPSQASNLGQQIQSLLCYHYTTRHRTPGAESGNRTHTGVAPQRFLRPSRLPVPPPRRVHLSGGDGRIRTADRGFADPRLNHLATSPCSQGAGSNPGEGSGAGERTRTSTGQASQQPLKLARLPVPPHPLGEPRQVRLGSTAKLVYRIGKAKSS